MSALFCCRRGRDMGAGLSHDEVVSEAVDQDLQPTMADVIRERKKKSSGGPSLGTLRRRIASAARSRTSRPDDAPSRFLRPLVRGWSRCECQLVRAQLSFSAALRDLHSQASLARPPANCLRQDLALLREEGWWCDVELVGSGWSCRAHRPILAARSRYFRDLLSRYPTSRRVPLLSVPAGRTAVEAALRALYTGDHRDTLCDHCYKRERKNSSENDLDVINFEGTNNGRACRCSQTGRRAAELLGAEPKGLGRDLLYLLDSGEYADTRLSFPGLSLPCHRAILAARCRLLRKVLSTCSGTVPVDERVLPARFARAILHAAYTDQVDLSLISRPPSSPTSTNSASGTSSWPPPRGSSRQALQQLEDACQLYEIARFLEMPILSQGCEDLVVSLLSAQTLPAALSWSALTHASDWVHRQSMRYLLDEFESLCVSGACRVPLSCLGAALASPFLQASEGAVVRAVVKWADNSDEPNLISGTTGNRRRKRELNGPALRAILAPLLPLVRFEHIPPNSEAMQLALRRGLISQLPAECGTVSAWLGRPPHRQPRVYMPYLDELKSLLQDRDMNERELAALRRARNQQKIPDTLYMLHSPPPPPVAPQPPPPPLPPPLRSSLVSRALELLAQPCAHAALNMADADQHAVRVQVALRVVRELGLPDSCADLLLPDLHHTHHSGDGSWSECEEVTSRDVMADRIDHCCRSGAASSSQGSLRRQSVGNDQIISSASVPVSSVPDVLPPGRGAPVSARPPHYTLTLDLGDGPRTGRQQNMRRFTDEMESGPGRADSMQRRNGNSPTPRRQYRLEPPLLSRGPSPQQYA